MGRLHSAPDPSLRSLVMKVIAHRGWSAGEDENTLAAFARAACDDRISGVEFDMCHAVDAMTLVVSHDPPLHIENTSPLMRHCRFFLRRISSCLWRSRRRDLPRWLSRSWFRVTWPTARSCSHLPPSHDPFRGRARDRCAWASLSHIHGI